jgi:hypothetical protein
VPEGDPNHLGVEPRGQAPLPGRGHFNRAARAGPLRNTWSMTEAATPAQSHPAGGPDGDHESLFTRVPGWLFHALLAATLLALLWAMSTPEWLFLVWFLGALFLFLLVVVWLVLALVDVRSRRKHGAPGTPRVLLVAPCLVLIAFGLAAVDAPLTARWLISRPSFEEVVEATPPATGDAWQQVGGPQRLGLYDVRLVFRVRDAVVFYETSGGFLDDSGFACLPSGPFPELEDSSFEGPQFEHLGGCWYTWTASW